MMRTLHCISLLALLVILYSCAHDKDLPASPRADPRLEAKFELYSSLAPEAPYEENCDGLLFRSLFNAALHREFDIESWRDGDLRWYRNRDHEKCKPTSATW
jgi:hypothetical protein